MKAAEERRGDRRAVPRARAVPSAAAGRRQPAGAAALPASARIMAWSIRLTQVAGALAASAGASALVAGWGLGMDSARALLPGGAPVQPLAAVELLLLGVSLCCLAGLASRGWRRAGVVCAAVAASVGGLTLAEHATGADLLVDRVLFSDGVGGLGGIHPGRLGLGTAACVTMLAVAHLSLHASSRRAVVASQALALVTGLTGLITFDNLLHSDLRVAPESIGSGWMAPVSAAGVTLLALGTTVARPGEGLTGAMTSASVAGVLGRRMLLAAATAPFLLGWAPSIFGVIGVHGERFGVLFVIGASVVVFAAVSFAAAGAAARLESASIQAGRQTRKSHAQLLALIDNTSAVIYIRDLEGRYLLANSEYERLFGIDRDHLAGHTDHELFPKEMADAFLANDRLALAAESPLTMEEQAPQDDGTHTYITVKFALTDAAGDAYAVCGISTDITARKRAEDEVQLLNAELELRVRERTEELEASARELDAFAYSVSHDLRAPLRSVDGFSQILLEDYGALIDPQCQDYLRRLRGATQRMGRLIDDLLKLSRTTRSELRREDVDVSELARATVTELRAADPGREVTVVIEAGMVAAGDRLLLGLVMENLLSNAWKFTARRRDARIEVQPTEHGGQSGFRVSDNGAGFDMRYAGKLFGAFQRLHSTAEFEGTGVGLATVQRIVRRHGGEVQAAGEPGNGATFTVALPSRLAAEPSTRLEQSH